MKKLNIGCGDHPLDGWINADICRRENTTFLDATKRFPFNDNSIDRIFSEHMIEHISAKDGLHMLAECYRVLQPGGRIRISTPDLMFLAALLSDPAGLERHNYINWAAREFRLPQGHSSFSVAYVVNNFVRAWGHQFIYTQEALCLTMNSVGFRDFKRCAIGKSEDETFQNLENDSRMPPGFLQLETMTFEAEKPL
jgi:predicted SAM-dependent methyltransferase